MPSAEKTKAERRLKKRGAGLRLKFTLIIASLVIFVVFLVSLPLGYFILLTESSSLASSLQQRADVLLESVAQGRALLHAGQGQAAARLPAPAGARHEGRRLHNPHRLRRGLDRAGRGLGHERQGHRLQDRRPEADRRILAHERRRALEGYPAPRLRARREGRRRGERHQRHHRGPHARGPLARDQDRRGLEAPLRRDRADPGLAPDEPRREALRPIVRLGRLHPGLRPLEALPLHRTLPLLQARALPAGLRPAVLPRHGTPRGLHPAHRRPGAQGPGRPRAHRPRHRGHRPRHRHRRRLHPLHHHRGSRFASS